LQDPALGLEHHLLGKLRDRAGALQGRVHQLLVGPDAAHDAELQCLGCLDHPAAQAEVPGHRRVEGRASRRVARRDAERDLGIAEGRRLGRKPNVAQQREGEAARKRGAVDGGEHGLWAPADGVKGAGAGLHEPLPVLQIAPELGRVHA